MHPVYTLQPGSTPLLISMPHVGTLLPVDQQHRYTERALQVEDTDWFLDRLYSFAGDLGATLLVPRFSRYLIDLNRSPDNAPMYPGQNNTELCPTRHFTGDAIYRPQAEPDEAEVQRRLAQYWWPYHRALQAQLDQLLAQHGHVVLFDAHSIHSTLPWLFEGSLPQMNIGTVQGASCHPSLEASLREVFGAQSSYSHVFNGRFKGGYITRAYGQPARGVHAVQLEMVFNAYMEETQPYRWHPQRAAAVSPLLRSMVQTMLRWKPEP
jgi:N-formylglutamate deformylase